MPGKSNPTPTKEKQEKKTKSRFDMAAEAASQRTPQGTLQSLALSYLLYSSFDRLSRCSTECFEWISEMAGLDMPNSARKETFTKSLTLRGSAGIRRTDFFWDTPWGAIPEHRLGALESMSSPRRGGLLGGSSKPSKLAALAAARKKKNEEKKQSQPSQSSELDRAVGLLDRLGSKKSLDASPVPETKMRKTPPPVSLKPVLRSKQIDDTPKVEAEPEPPQAPLHDRHCSVQQGQPTAFAQTLFGSRHKKPIAMRFLHPYVDNPKHTSADPFAKPSPDDIVIAAQSKGSWNA
jgi:elongation factor 1 alpha-like protein